MKKIFKTKGICAREIHFEVNNGVVKDVEFIGGCAGNAKGVAALVRGMKTDDVIEKLRGTPCRFGTSCPDQLAKALAEDNEAK